VTFHNGEVFDAEIVKLNWEQKMRLDQPYPLAGLIHLAPNEIKTTSEEILNDAHAAPDRSQSPAGQP
jgi:hypothetical protein